MTITIDRLAPGMNTMHKWHWAKRQREKDAWAHLIREQVGSRVPKYRRCEIVMDRYYARNQMDHDNLTSTAKCVLDAMSRVGIIPDDDPNVVVSLEVAQHKVDRVKDQRTEITLRPCRTE